MGKKKVSVLMSLVVALMSLFSANVFAIPAPFEWDNIPTIFWDEDINITTMVQSGDVLAESGDDEANDDAWLDGQASIMSTEKKPVDQPQFAPKAGYDVISTFITQDDSVYQYTGKVFFVISNDGQWCLFNYKQETANKYLEKTEVVNGMLVPAKTADTRKDNPDTKVVDEAKIPLIKKSEFAKMTSGWREFKDIPFARDSSGNLVYATWDAPKEDDPKKDDPRKGGPQNTPSWNSTTDDYWYCYTNTTNRGNIYKVFVTKSVSYNGKKHVLVNGKSGKNRSNDIQVYAFLNGQGIPENLYKVSFKNSKNCNGYGSNRTRPYVRLKFKFKNKALKPDIKAMYKHAFGFDVTPLDISKGSISYKSMKKGVLKKAVWTGPDGTAIKLVEPNEEDWTGDYRLFNENGRIYAQGVNNFVGKLMLGPAYNAPGTNNNTGWGGGQIY